MFDFLQKLKRNHVWSIALYIQDEEFSFQRKTGSPDFVLNSKKLRISKNHVHTYADPFLFLHDEYLYLFFESQAVAEDGKIEAIRTRDLKHFDYIGEIIKEPHHLSFPFVFEYDGDIFLMPETLATNEIALYKFENFPDNLVKSRVLLKGAYKDSSLIRHNEVWYFFTTSGDGLELFYTDDLEEGHLIPHSQNPLSENPRYNQCGGSPIALDGQLYRIAQDGSSEYGKNISILKINELSKTAYEEEVLIDDYFDLRDGWNARGGHHLSLARFLNKSVVAVDGKQNDFLINKLLSIFY